MKYFQYQYLIIILITFSFISCEKENPVTSINEFNLDTAHFRWEVTPIPFDDFFLSGLWAADTNEVFAINLFYRAMLHIKGDAVNIIYYTDSTRYNFIDGLSPTEGYMVCSEFRKGVWLPAIKRWNGNSFSDIPMVSNYNKTFKPCSFLLKSSTEMWIGDNGLVHKFDGLNLTQQYFQDSEIVAVKLFFDQNNHLMAHGRKSLDSITNEYLLEYNGSEWIKSYEDSHLAWLKPYGVMNNFIYAYDYPNIYKVEDNVLKLAFVLPNEVYISLPFAGSSFNDFMAAGFQIGGGPSRAVLYWNGKKWSYEKANNDFFMYGDDIYLQRINDNFYCGIVQRVPPPFLIRGFRK